MSSFVKIADRVVYVDENNKIHSLDATLNIIPDPIVDYRFYITRKTLINTKDEDPELDLRVSARSVTLPAPSGETWEREDLISELSENFFNSKQETSTLLITAMSQILQNTYNLLDLITNNYWLTSSDVHHDLIHQGVFFNTSHFLVNLGNDANYDILIETGAKTLDVEMFSYLEGEAEHYIYEAPTATQGTVLPNINKSRNSNVLAGAIFSHSPSVSSVGDLLYQSRQGLGSNYPSTPEDKTEWLFKPNTKYLIRTVNRTGQNNKTVSFKAQFHELAS